MKKGNAVSVPRPAVPGSRLRHIICSRSCGEDSQPGAPPRATRKEHDRMKGKNATRTPPPAANGGHQAQPILGQQGPEIQPFGTLTRLPLGLDDAVRQASVADLNQILADTMTLRDLYKKHHWQVAGHTFYQLHLLFDKHYGEQSELVDSLAERIQTL